MIIFSSVRKFFLCELRILVQLCSYSNVYIYIVVLNNIENLSDFIQDYLWQMDPIMFSSALDKPSYTRFGAIEGLKGYFSFSSRVEEFLFH